MSKALMLLDLHGVRKSNMQTNLGGFSKSTSE
jgi:hypothetical protein